MIPARQARLAAAGKFAPAPWLMHTSPITTTWTFFNPVTMHKAELVPSLCDMRFLCQQPYPGAKKPFASSRLLS